MSLAKGSLGFEQSFFLFVKDLVCVAVVQDWIDVTASNSVAQQSLLVHVETRGKAVGLLPQETVPWVESQSASEFSRSYFATCQLLQSEFFLSFAALELAVPVHHVEFRPLNNIIRHFRQWILDLWWTAKLVLLSLVRFKLTHLFQVDEILVSYISIFIPVQSVEHLFRMLLREIDSKSVQDEVEFFKADKTLHFDIELSENVVWCSELQVKLMLQML